MPTSKVKEKELFHTFFFMYFAIIFSERIKRIMITSYEETSKVREHNFFFRKRNRKVALLVVYLLITIQRN